MPADESPSESARWDADKGPAGSPPEEFSNGPANPVVSSRWEAAKRSAASVRRPQVSLDL
jgi:hypothetical protein